MTTASRNAVELHSLPGVAGGVLTGVMVNKTINAIVKAYKVERCVCAAGDAGAITVYTDDEGKHRCVFSRYLSIIHSDSFKYRNAVKSWLDEYVPRLTAR
jgi:hypothetical protein